MSKRIAVLTFTVVIAAGLAACAPAAAPTPTPDAMMAATPEAMMGETPETMMATTPEAMMDKTPDAMMSQAMTDTLMAATPDAMMATTPEAMMDKTPDAMMAQATMTDTMMALSHWFSVSFTEATSGATFRIQDFKDKVILVETMALECPTCMEQQKEIKALHDQLGMRDDLVTLSIDVDSNETLAGLKEYVAKNGYAWLHTVASTEVAREISDLYGAEFLNPSSAAMLIIDKHGEAHPLPFGVKTAADLQKALEPYLSDAM